MNYRSSVWYNLYLTPKVLLSSFKSVNMRLRFDALLILFGSKQFSCCLLLIWSTITCHIIQQLIRYTVYNCACGRFCFIKKPTVNPVRFRLIWIWCIQMSIAVDTTKRKMIFHSSVFLNQGSTRNTANFLFVAEPSSICLPWCWINSGNIDFRCLFTVMNSNSNV